MASFLPPTDAQSPPSDSSAGSVPAVAMDRKDLTDPIANRLMRWYSTRRRGRNVFILKDGTVTEVLPAATYGANGDLVLSGWDQVADDPNEGKPLTGNPEKQVFWGGHGSYQITAAQQTLLTNAGYGAYIT